MRLEGRPEPVLDAEMQLPRSDREPDTAAFGEVCRLLDLGESEEAAIEAPRLVLAIARHGDLDVIDVDDRADADHRIAAESAFLQPDERRAALARRQAIPLPAPRRTVLQ